MAAGFATGLAMVVDESPAEGLHEKVTPPDALKLAEDPEHIVSSTPAFTVMVEPTVIRMSSVSVQPFASVTRTVYVVVADGEASGLLILTSDNPVAGLQKYVVPPPAFNVVNDPLQMVSSFPASAVGKGFIVTVTLLAMLLVQVVVVFVATTV